MTFTVRNQMKPRNGSQCILVKRTERSYVEGWMVFIDMSQNSRTWTTIFRKLVRRCLLGVFSENFWVHNKQLLHEVFVIFISNIMK